MSEKLVNGDSPKSHVVAHITSYPLVSDSISAYKSNAYGQKSISLTEDIYTRVVAPFLPYLQGPYSWVAPYLAKADEFGDSALSKADERFPIVKDDTEKIKSTIFEYAHYPITLAQSSKDYVFGSYKDESGKVGGDGVVHLVKSVISTELRILSDGLHVVAEFVGPKKKEAEDLVKEKYEQLKKTVGPKSKEAQDVVSEKTDQAGKAINEQTDKAGKVVDEKTEQVKKSAKK